MVYIWLPQLINQIRRFVNYNTPKTHRGNSYWRKLRRQQHQTSYNHSHYLISGERLRKFDRLARTGTGDGHRRKHRPVDGTETDAHQDGGHEHRRVEDVADGPSERYKWVRTPSLPVWSDRLTWSLFSFVAVVAGLVTLQNLQNLASLQQSLPQVASLAAGLTNMAGLTGNPPINAPLNLSVSASGNQIINDNLNGPAGQVASNRF